MTYNPEMRSAHALLLLAAVTSVAAVALTAPSAGSLFGFGEARAEDESTLYISGLDIGPGKKAIVRLRNTSTRAADTLTVHYTVRDPSIGHPLSALGAGIGARLAAGDTLELDLGEIVDAHRATQEVGGWDGPVQFVAFGTGGQFGDFGPETVQVEAVQKVKRAQFTLPVEWIED